MLSWTQATTRHFDIAANVGVKNSGGFRIVHECFQILLLEKETCGSAMKNVEGCQSNEVRLGRDKLDKGAFCEVCYGDDFLSLSTITCFLLSDVIYM